MGVFVRLMIGLAAEAPDSKTISIDASYLKVHSTASILRFKRGGRGRLIGQSKGGMNNKLHAVTNENGHPIRFFISDDDITDYTGTAVFLCSLPSVQWLLADRGCDEHGLLEGSENSGMMP